MLFTKSFSLLYLLCITSMAFGMGSNSPQSKGTLLFKITHPNSKHTSYLFGTHHAFGKSFFDSLTTANQALASSTMLIKENLNLPGHTAEDIINKRQNKTNWRKYLNNNDLKFIVELFTTSPTDYTKMTPAELYAFLNRYFKQRVCLEKESTDTSLSLDDYIGQKAEELNIPLIGLETTEDQIALLNADVEGMPRKHHGRRLANIIQKIQTKNNRDCGETDWYAQMEMDYQLDKPCVNALVLTDRNNKWMSTLVNLLESNDCFIAVGLSHLMYDCGLLKQLQGLGYTITPIDAL